ncbi:CASP8 and FADD-like apoptosis regulator a [Thalassophryne amazonica]|uniref:CASP8 and FADD-like apoptosis regulator a n=1 Tax=Thalassophryne amazonica TaxID=390379 RepID=UPI001471D233|nr:CASP8 and FADD-like apoptosis regulator a [Thalassophryne amazonica]
MTLLVHIFDSLLLFTLWGRKVSKYPRSRIFSFRKVRGEQNKKQQKRFFNRRRCSAFETFFIVSVIMALSDQQLLQRINETTEALSSSERRSLLYLCGSLDADNSVAHAKELLKAKLTSSPTEDERFLLELMFQLKRFDILRKVFGLNRDRVEAILRHSCNHVLPRFRVLMVNVSEDMANEDLNSVKFLLSKMLPREKMDKATDFLDVIVELEKLDQVSSERVDFLEQCLQNIGRVDLAKKVHMYETSGGSFEQYSAPRISLQQRPRAPIQHPNSNFSHPVHRPILGHSHRCVQETTPAPVATQQNHQTALESYNLRSDPRGLCVIIDCVGYDGDFLEHRFKALHFSVLVHKWLSVTDILSTLRGIFHHRENCAVDSFVCCIISRSTVTHLLGTDSNVAGLPLDTVRRLFTAQECPVLAGKPKVFFIQTYKIHESQTLSWTNHMDESLETDGYDSLCPQDFVPTDADIFWSHCWTDEFELAQAQHHSNYLKALTDALHRGQSRKSDLLDIHTEVNDVIYDHNQKNPGAKYHIDVKHTLRKNLYFG